LSVKLPDESSPEPGQLSLASSRARKKWHDRRSGLSNRPIFGRERAENIRLRLGTETARFMKEIGVFVADSFKFRPDSHIMAVE